MTIEVISLKLLQSQLATHTLHLTEYQTEIHLNLYDSVACERLATQALAGRHLRFQARSADDLDTSRALPICLCEDDYPGWIAATDLSHIHLASIPYQPPPLTQKQIQAQIPAVIAFAQAAMAEPNTYLWGGTIGPNYDCSGLIQRAFGHQGIWLPRDAYQQEAFVEAIPNPGNRPADWIEVLQPGDLIFFGTPEKADHVALYLNEGRYLHSSGSETGRNGIGIDSLAENSDGLGLDFDRRISHHYYHRVRGVGRVVSCYQPTMTASCDSKERTSASNSKNP